MDISDEKAANRARQDGEDYLIQRAFLKSGERFQKIDEAAWTLAPVLDVSSNTNFAASVTQTPVFTVQISKGCVEALKQIRRQCSVELSEFHALEWLILHELHHAVLGHFELTNGIPVLFLVSRRKRETIPLNDLPEQLCHRVSPCLELQADHDALEMMLGDYSADDWASIRTQAASIAAVMILIEKAGSWDGDKPSSHPHAATRIFQLLGHVAEMWSIPAHAKANARGDEAIRDDDLPPQVEVQAFSSEVVLPVFWDAVALAEAAEAESIISDLGSPEDFFADIGRAKLGQWDKLVTVGAKEWATLKDVNEAILPLLSKNHAMN